MNSLKVTSVNASGSSLMVSGVKIIPLVRRRTLRGDSFIHAGVNPEFLIFVIDGKYYFFDLGKNSGSESDENLKDFLSAIESEY